jgi:hypothetical protein
MNRDIRFGFEAGPFQMLDWQATYSLSTVETSRLETRSDFQDEAAGFSEMLVAANKKTRRHIQEERQESWQFHDSVNRSFNSKMAASMREVPQWL